MGCPHILYQSKTPTDCAPFGQPRLVFPLPPESGPVQFAALAFDQDFEQRLDQFPPAPKNTPSNASAFGLNNAKAILTALSQPLNSGAALGKFAGTFTVVPATWSDERELPFTFPGFPGIIGQTGSRNAFTDVVATRIQHDYYVLDPANIISTVADGTPGTATSLLDSGGTAVKVVYKRADIPIINKSIFCVALSGTPDYTNRTDSLIISGGATVAGVNYYQTQPTKTVYQSWIANAVANGWASTVWPGNNNTAGSYGQLVAKDSETQSYAGNIIERLTLYVLAK